LKSWYLQIGFEKCMVKWCCRVWTGVERVDLRFGEFSLVRQKVNEIESEKNTHIHNEQDFLK